MKRLAALCAITLAGCASYSGVVPAGDGTYMVTKQAATGFPGLGNMKAEVLQDANAQCAKTNEAMLLVSENETKPPYIFGNFPRVEIHFRCVAKPA